MAKISQILSILSFIISTSMLGGGYFGYKYVYVGLIGLDFCWILLFFWILDHFPCYVGYTDEEEKKHFSWE